MKSLPLILGILILFSCKKSNDAASNKFTEDSQIVQRLNFRVAVTKPSPYDVEHHSTKDSIIINHLRKVGLPDALQNQYTFMGLDPALSFGLDTTNFTSTGHSAFSLTGYMIPSVNLNSSLNTAYENTYRGDYYSSPIFLSMHEGNGITVGHYFASGSTKPNDANDAPQVIVYCQFTLLKKYEVAVNAIRFIVVDGKFSGYYEAHWGKTDLNKYVNRFDFTCDFEGVRL